MAGPPKTPGGEERPAGLVDDPGEDDRTHITLPAARAAAVGRRDRASVMVLAGGVVGEIHAVEREVTVIGRGQEADVRIDDNGISRRHARIISKPGGQFFIEDLGSTNGTSLGDTPLTELQQLSNNDRIRVGKTVVLKFSVHDDLERSFHKQMYESAVRDPLTGAFNRKYLMDRLRTELSYSRRHGRALSMLMLDIDHFKRVNDTHGHLAGDAALHELSALLARQVRAEDLVARYGGEEFVLLARGTDERGTLALAERVREAVAAMLVDSEAGGFRITVSIGVAFTPDGAAFGSADEMIGRADANLYAAKEAGRNRVVM